MKVCLFHESQRMLSISGIGNAFENLKKAIKSNDVKFTTNPNEDYDILHLNFIGLQSFNLAMRAKKQGKKIVIHTHTTQEDIMNSVFLSNVIAPSAKLVLKRFYSMADVLISPSYYTKYIMRSYGLTNRIELVSNGVDTNKFKFSAKKGKEFRRKHGIKNDAVFSVGIPFKRKGIYDFIEVAKKLPDNDFYWVGKKLKMIAPDTNSAFNNHPDNVQFLGYVDDIIAAYSGGDVFLFPSYEENQGIVILEAASMGKPIIVRDIGAYQGWLVHGQNCLKAKDNEEFAGHVKSVLENKGLRDKLVANAKKMALENDLKVVGKEYKRIYESLM